MSRHTLTSEQLHVVDAILADFTARSRDAEGVFTECSLYRGQVVMKSFPLRDEGAVREFVTRMAHRILRRTDPREDLAFFTGLLVDEFQQCVHDEFVDVSWPRCPRHPHHPLWFEGGEWRCKKDNAPLAKLGELAAISGRA